MMGLVPLWREFVCLHWLPPSGTPPAICTKKRSYEYAEGSHLKTKGRALLRLNSSVLAPWSQTCSLQKYKKINFCCLSHPVYGICYGSLSKLITSTEHQCPRGPPRWQPAPLWQKCKWGHLGSRCCIPKGAVPALERHWVETSHLHQALPKSQNYQQISQMTVISIQ